MIPAIDDQGRQWLIDKRHLSYSNIATCSLLKNIDDITVTFITGMVRLTTKSLFNVIQKYERSINTFARIHGRLKLEYLWKRCKILLVAKCEGELVRQYSNVSSHWRRRQTE